MEPSGEIPKKHVIPRGLTLRKRLNRFKECSGEFVTNQSITEADLGTRSVKSSISKLA